MQYRVMIVRIKSKKRIHMDKMSTRKGSTSKGAQRHKNSAAYNPSRYGQSRRVKQAAAASLGGLCSRCREKIEWKKKYDKYKPLTVPKKCILCGERQVKQAYYQICQKCAEEREVCAKCGHKEGIIERFTPDKRQETREEAEFRAGLKHTRERERRTLLREQSQGTPTDTCASTLGTDKTLSEESGVPESVSDTESSTDL